VFPDRQERPEKEKTIILSAQKKNQAEFPGHEKRRFVGGEMNFSRKQI
jgi:hypothetical protein